MYRRLFGAQVVALTGTGFATVALSLLANEIAGARAGQILASIFVIKMVCYVGLAPVASAISSFVPRRALLVGLDVVRVGVAAGLPIVTSAWQVYALMALLYAAAAAFTPAFQATIPDILSDEAEYTKALSLSRLAADFESVVSPLLAAGLLALMSFHELFAGTSLGFAFSAALILSTRIPRAKEGGKPFLRRLVTGLNLFVHTPRLRGVFAISLATAGGGAMVFVNTVVLVQSEFGLGEQAMAFALAVFGLGSILSAMALPSILERVSERRVLITGALASTACMAIGPWWARNYFALLALWLILGAGYSFTLTPIGRILRRSSHVEDRPALFAAQFALSHACWLIAYPLAGYTSANLGIGAAFLALGLLCAGGTAFALVQWPARDPLHIPHDHDDLAPDHPHVAGAPGRHEHEFVIDDLHRRWPRQ